MQNIALRSNYVVTLEMMLVQYQVNQLLQLYLRHIFFETNKCPLSFVQLLYLGNTEQSQILHIKVSTQVLLKQINSRVIIFGHNNVININKNIKLYLIFSQSEERIIIIGLLLQLRLANLSSSHICSHNRIVLEHNM